MHSKVLLDTQVALFFKDRLTKPAHIATNFKGDLATVFDQTPLILPIPDNPEFDSVPVAQLQSTTAYSANISRKVARIMFSGNGHQEIGEIQEEFIRRVCDFFTAVTTLGGAQVSRVGFVSNFVLEEKNAAQRISRLISPDFTSHQEGEIHAAKIRYITRSQLSNFTLNNLTEVTSGKASKTEADSIVEIEGVMVMRDINTIPETDVSADLNTSSLETIIKHGISLFNLREIEESIWKSENKE